jgi:hypothetical protein
VVAVLESTAGLVAPHADWLRASPGMNRRRTALVGNTVSGGSPTWSDCGATLGMFRDAWARAYAERYALYRMYGTSGPSGYLVSAGERTRIRSVINLCLGADGRPWPP